MDVERLDYHFHSAMYDYTLATLTPRCVVIRLYIAQIVVYLFISELCHAHRVLPLLSCPSLSEQYSSSKGQMAVA